MKIPLGTASYQSTSVPFSAQRCVNLYAVAARDTALNDTALFGTPGIAAFGDGVGSLATDRGRGAVVMGGVLYSVQGNILYEIDSSGTATSRGAIAGTSRVSMAHNGLVLCIVVPGSTAYAYTAATTTLATITDADYQLSDSVTFKDGYYIFTRTDGTQWFVSALNDPTDIDALDFGSAELNPDDIVCSHITFDEVLIFGTETTELFSNIGGAGFPFQRIQGASWEKGCHAKYSPIQWDKMVYFIGGGKNEKSGIYRGRGAQPEKISTDAIDSKIQEFTASEIADAFTFTYSVRGYDFVGFTFRSLIITDRTFVYNVTFSNLSGQHTWFEQQSGVSETAWRVNSITNVYNKLVVTDNVDGSIGYLDVDTYTDYSDVLLREKVTGPIADENPLYFSRLELTVDGGHGLITGQGSDPMVMMDYSDDGARTWSNELWRTLGKIGKYKIGAVWRRLGRAEDGRVFRFRQTDPIKTVWIKLEGMVSSGT